MNRGVMIKQIKINNNNTTTKDKCKKNKYYQKKIRIFFKSTKIQRIDI